MSNEDKLFIKLHLFFSRTIRCSNKADDSFWEKNISILPYNTQTRKFAEKVPLFLKVKNIWKVFVLCGCQKCQERTFIFKSVDWNSGVQFNSLRCLDPNISLTERLTTRYFFLKRVSLKSPGWGEDLASSRNKRLSWGRSNSSPSVIDCYNTLHSFTYTTLETHYLTCPLRRQHVMCLFEEIV